MKTILCRSFQPQEEADVPHLSKNGGLSGCHSCDVFEGTALHRARLRWTVRTHAGSSQDTRQSEAPRGSHGDRIHLPESRVRSSRDRASCSVIEETLRDRAPAILCMGVRATVRALVPGATRARRIARPRSSSRTPRDASVTISRGPGTSWAAIGSPQASASIITIPNVSVRDGNTKTSADL